MPAVIVTDLFPIGTYEDITTKKLLVRLDELGLPRGNLLIDETGEAVIMTEGTSLNVTSEELTDPEEDSTYKLYKLLLKVKDADGLEKEIELATAKQDLSGNYLAILEYDDDNINNLKIPLDTSILQADVPSPTSSVASPPVSPTATTASLSLTSSSKLTAALTPNLTATDTKSDMSQPAPITPTIPEKPKTAEELRAKAEKNLAAVLKNSLYQIAEVYQSELTFNNKIKNFVSGLDSIASSINKSEKKQLEKFLKPYRQLLALQPDVFTAMKDDGEDLNLRIKNFTDEMQPDVMGNNQFIKKMELLRQITVDQESFTNFKIKMEENRDDHPIKNFFKNLDTGQSNTNNMIVAVQRAPRYALFMNTLIENTEKAIELSRQFELPLPMTPDSINLVKTHGQIVSDKGISINKSRKYDQFLHTVPPLLAELENKIKTLDPQRNTKKIAAIKILIAGIEYSGNDLQATREYLEIAKKEIGSGRTGEIINRYAAKIDKDDLSIEKHMKNDKIKNNDLNLDPYYRITSLAQPLNANADQDLKHGRVIIITQPLLDNLEKNLAALNKNAKKNHAEILSMEFLIQGIKLAGDDLKKIREYLEIAIENKATDPKILPDTIIATLANSAAKIDGNHAEIIREIKTTRDAALKQTLYDYHRPIAMKAEAERIANELKNRSKTTDVVNSVSSPRSTSAPPASGSSRQDKSEIDLPSFNNSDFKVPYHPDEIKDEIINVVSSPGLPPAPLILINSEDKSPTHDAKYDSSFSSIGSQLFNVSNKAPEPGTQTDPTAGQHAPHQSAGALGHSAGSHFTPATQTAYEYIVAQNNQTKKRFIDSADNGQTVTIIEPKKAFSITGGSKLGDVSTATSYTLTKTAMGEHGLSIVNKDGEFETLTLVTEPANIKKLLRAGVFSPDSMQNPITKMIAKIGEYKCKVAERSEEENLKVRNNQQRLDIVDFTQDCLEKLQPLLMSVNNYNENKTPQQNIAAMKETLQAYISELAAVRSQLPNLNKEPYKSLSDGIKRLQESTKEYIDTLSQHQNSKEAEIKKLLRPHGYNNVDKFLNLFGSKSNMSLQDFIQSQLNKLTKTAHIANHGLTGWLRDTSGLAACIEEAQFTGEEFAENANAKDPFALEHSLDFSKRAVNDKTSIDLVRYGAKVGSKLDLARTISMVDNTVAGKPLTKREDKEPGILGINFTGGVMGAVKSAGRSFIKGFGFQTAGFVGDGLYFLGRGAIYAGTLGRYNPPFNPPSNFLRAQAEKSWISPKHDHYKEDELTKDIYNKENPLTKLDEKGMGEKIVRGVAGLILDYPVDALVGVGQIFKNEILDRKTAREILYDATIGMRDVSNAEVSALLQKRAKQSKANHSENEIQMQALIDEYNKQHKDKPIDSEKIEEILALKSNNAGVAALPYDVKSQEGRDALSWFTLEFTKSIGNVFSHEIYRLHPVAGLAFTLGASMAAPMALPMLAHTAAGAWMATHVNAPIAKLFVGETSGTSATVSVGLLQGKAVFLTLDAFNGRESLFAKGLTALLQNPIPAAVIGIAAVAIGDWVAQQSIPMLSSEAASVYVNATIPQFELSLIGAKVVAILVEVNMSGEHESKIPKIEKMLHECHTRLKDHFTQVIKITRCPELTQGDLVTIDALTQAELDKATATRASEGKDPFTQAELNNLAKETSNTETNKFKVQKYDDERSAADKSQDDTDIIRIVEKQKKAYTTIANTPDKKLTQDVNQFTIKIQAEINASKGIAPGPAPKEPNWKVERQAKKLMQQTEIRQSIEGIDQKVFTQEDKYTIMTNAKQNYPNDPDYIAALRAHLYEEKPSGRLSTSLKIAVSYPLGIIRGLATGIRSAFYSVAGIVSPEMRTKASRTYAQVGSMAEEAYDKTTADVAIIAKGGAGIARTLWAITGAALALPATFVALPFTSLWNLARGKPIPRPREVYETIKTALVAPGVVSQMINSSVGELNAGAQAKNLGLATENINARELRRFANDKAVKEPAPTVSSASTNNRSTVQMEQLLQQNADSKMLNLLQTTFSKNLSLAKIIISETTLNATLDAITKSIIENNKKIANKGRVTTIFGDTQQDQMKHALIEIHNFIDLPGVINNNQHRESILSKIDTLQQLNQADPIIEFQKAYSGFLKSTKLNAPRLDTLRPFYNDLTAAILNLSLFNEYPQTLNREKPVLDLLTKSPCLSLKNSLSAMIEIKKIISALETQRGTLENKTEKAEIRNKLADAKHFLRAYERVYQSAQQGNNQLAIYDRVVDKLAGYDSTDSLELENYSRLLSPEKIKSIPGSSPTVSDGVIPPPSIISQGQSTVIIEPDQDKDSKQNPLTTAANVSDDSAPDPDEEKYDLPSSKQTSQTHVTTQPPLASLMTRTISASISLDRSTPKIADENTADITAMLAAYVSKTLPRYQYDASAREILANLGVVSKSRDHKVEFPVVIDATWKKTLDSLDPKLLENFKPISDIQVAIREGWQRRLDDSTIETPKSDEKIMFAKPAAKSTYTHTTTGAEFEVNQRTLNDSFDFSMTKIPEKTGADTLQKNAHYILQMFVEANGANKQIDINGSDEKQVEIFILLCKANHIDFINSSSFEIENNPQFQGKLDAIIQDKNLPLLLPSINDDSINNIQRGNIKDPAMNTIIDNMYAGTKINAQHLRDLGSQFKEKHAPSQESSLSADSHSENPKAENSVSSGSRRP
jgi:hypothetical protein